MMGGVPVVVTRVKNRIRKPGNHKSTAKALSKGLRKKLIPKSILAKKMGGQRGYYVDTSLLKMKSSASGKTFSVEVSCSLTVSQAPGRALRLNSRATTGGRLEGGNKADQESLVQEVASACGGALGDDVLAFEKRRKK
ncbi:MAG: hypothetical protein GY822_31740 [Deltaproteobacteria bacterium]|nr:hypothetical protein [Deltaproteobacteria bacterium]